MPRSSKERVQSPVADMVQRAYLMGYTEAATTLMKQEGFTVALKALNKGQLKSFKIGTIKEGKSKKLPSDKNNASLQTNIDPLFPRNVERRGRISTDPQLSSSNTRQTLGKSALSGEFTPDQLIRQLDESSLDASSSLLCTIELIRFVPSQHQVLLPLLWQYILNHRNSNDRDQLVGVAAAIRKYIAIMPMGQMGKLAALLDTGHRSPLSIDLEIEVAKMVYRNFEVHPPVVEDPQPELAQRFWDIVQAYINPRVLLRDKCSAATSLAIEAIVSMRSPLAEDAWRAAIACPYRWFSELVADDLDELHETWGSKNSDAAAWLNELRSNVLAQA